MKYDKFFALAKEAGIQDAELYINQSVNLSFSLFHGEVDQYSSSNGFSIIARGIVNGKFGSVACDSWSKDKPEYLVKEILTNAKLSENDDPVFIFGGSPKYKKINVFNKDLENVSIDSKMDELFKLEKLIKDGDGRVSEVEVGYEESKTVLTILNSKGLKLNQKNNYFVYYGSAVVKQDEQTKSNFELFFDNDFSKLNVPELAKKVVDGAVAQLNGDPCPTGTYKTIIDAQAFKSLLSFYIGQTDAEEIQKKSSLFVDKLNQKVASKKITVSDMPLAKTLFARPFDDEGVATTNRPIVKNGILQTYLYNLTTAAKDGVETTGNAQRSGAGTIGAAPFYLVLKPGKKSLEQMFEEVGNGVYINDISGLHAGLNAQSGNFSLVSGGFLIKNGKKDRSLDMVTISGNLKDLFNNIIEVGSDTHVYPSAISCSSVLVKKLAITGK